MSGSWFTSYHDYLALDLVDCCRHWSHRTLFCTHCVCDMWYLMRQWRLCLPLSLCWQKGFALFEEREKGLFQHSVAVWKRHGTIRVEVCLSLDKNFHCTSIGVVGAVLHGLRNWLKPRFVRFFDYFQIPVSSGIRLAIPTIFPWNRSDWMIDDVNREWRCKSGNDWHIA